MKTKVIAINCNNSNIEEIKSIQDHFFNEGIEWYSSKYYDEKKYKENINNYIIVEKNYLYEGDNDVLDSVKDDVDILIFNTPIEFLRYYKIKNLKSKIV